LIFRFAILVEGIQSAARDHKTLSAASAAAAVDRDLSRQFADQLPKPLPPLPTFLSFAGLPQLAEYVEVCRSVISPTDWILLPGDAALLEKLPKSPATEKIDAVARQRIAARSTAASQRN
jgi:hypothetical protein